MALTRYTLAELDKRLLERLDGHSYFTQQDRLDALRLALAVWQAGTAAVRTTIGVPAIVGDPYVPVPGLAQVLSVRWADHPLLPTTIEELGHLRPNWRYDVAGASGLGLSRPQYWAPIGMTAVALWPAPDVSATITCTGVGLPQAPSTALSDVVDLPDAAMDGVIGLAAWWCAGKATTDEQDKYQPQLDLALAGMAQASAVHGAADAFRTFLQALSGRTVHVVGQATPTEAA